ncbi:Crp/Fnr family transcriptional regulator [Mucilaginibacter polytrichastri]|nr:Crp/Fnr family transcriptional regulator [Mucilaginibacter polytrichastri]
MNTEPLFNLLNSVTELSGAFKDVLIGHLKEEKIKAHQIIHAAGQTENRLWFVESGFARSYYFDQTGKEHTLTFYTTHDVIFSYKGFWKETTDYYLEVVSESKLISLSYESLCNLIDIYPEAWKLVTVFIRQRYYLDLFKSRLMTWSAEERYAQFRKASPEIFRLASVRLIASYLNMTRENLSRLMGKDL